MASNGRRVERACHVHVSYNTYNCAKRGYLDFEQEHQVLQLDLSQREKFHFVLTLPI